MAPVVSVPSLTNACLKYLERKIVAYLTQQECLCQGGYAAEVRDIEGGTANFANHPDNKEGLSPRPEGREEWRHNVTWRTADTCDAVAKAKKELQESLPPVLLQELLQRLLRNDCMASHFGALQLLMNKHIKNVTFTSDPYIYRRGFLLNLIENGDGLIGLQVDYFWFKEQEIPLLRTTLGRLRNLMSLTLRVECDLDAVLLTVGRSCPSLQNLDVSRSCHPTEAGIFQLCFQDSPPSRACDTPVHRRPRNPCCNTLETFSTGAEYVNKGDLPPSLLAVVIQACPNLQALPTYPYSGEALVAALESLDQPRMSTFTTRLRYLCDTKTDVERLKMLAAICPDLERLCLYSAQTQVFGSLHLLTKVKDLTIQAISWDGLTTYLDRHGKKVEALKLDGAARNFAEMQLARGVLNLAVVGATCPGLRRLRCQDTSIGWQSDDPLLRRPGRCINYFSQLTHLFLWGCDLPKSALMRLLGCCTALEELRFFSCSKMSDADLGTVLSQNPFPKLRTFCVKQAEELSVDSVRMLIDTCPLLTWVGCLACWRVNQQELIELRAYIKGANLDVCISEYGRPE